jgi:hypothetical protein
MLPSTIELFDNMVVEPTLEYNKPDLKCIQKPADEELTEIPESPREKDLCEIYVKDGKHVFDISNDVMVDIFSYLEFEDVLRVGLVCKHWRQITKHNVLWSKFLTERFGEEEFLIQKHKKKRNKSSRYMEMKLRSAKRKSKKRAKSKSWKISHPSTQYYSMFKKRVMYLKKKREEEERARISEELRKYYHAKLERPQKWCERIYISLYSPLFFFISLATSILFPLYMDKYIPNTIWTLFGVYSGVLCILCPLYFVAGVAAFLSDYMRTFMWNTHFDSSIVIAFVGNVWMPILAVLVALKIFVLPPTILWRAALAPLWVISFIQCVMQLFVHHRLKIKFGKEQKIVWGITTFVNAVICITSGLAAAKLDGVSTFGYLSIVFIPIWILLFFGLIAIAVGFYFFVHNEGWKSAIFIYSPLVITFIVPWLPFFILLGLRLDNIVQIHYLIIFAPLYFKFFVWFIVTSIFGIMVWCDFVI